MGVFYVSYISVPVQFREGQYGRGMGQCPDSSQPPSTSIKFVDNEKEDTETDFTYTTN